MVGHPACHTGYSNPNGYACVTPLRERERRKRDETSSCELAEVSRGGDREISLTGAPLPQAARHL